MSNYKAIEATEKMMALLGEELIILKEELKQAMDNRSFSDVMKTASQLNKYVGNGYNLLYKGEDYFRFKKRVVEEFFDLVEDDLFLEGVSLERHENGTIQFYREESKMGTLYSDYTFILLTLSNKRKLQVILDDFEEKRNESGGEMNDLKKEDEIMDVLIQGVLSNSFTEDLLQSEHLDIDRLDEFYLSKWLKEMIRKNEMNWVGKLYKRHARRLTIAQLKKKRIQVNLMERKQERHKRKLKLEDILLNHRLDASRAKASVEPKIVKEEQFLAILDQYGIEYRE